MGSLDSPSAGLFAFHGLFGFLIAPGTYVGQITGTFDRETTGFPSISGVQVEVLHAFETIRDKAIQRIRQNFRLAVREQIASTLEDPSDENILEEMIQLQKSLASP